MSYPVRVLGFSGSLRRGSYNTALLRAAAELAPDGMVLETFDLASIPLYNEDIRSEYGFPEAVAAFRERIAAADALLIVTPEYNHSVPGVLKNALDWASRPPDAPLNEKPAAIMGASTGIGGTGRAQEHLRQVLTFMNVYPVNKPEVLVARAPEKFDTAGRLVDGATRQYVAQLLENLLIWTQKVGQRSEELAAA
jgi:chromate reductase